MKYKYNISYNDNSFREQGIESLPNLEGNSTEPNLKFLSKQAQELNLGY